MPATRTESLRSRQLHALAYPKTIEVVVKRILLGCAAAAALVAGLSCDNPTAPDTGTVAVTIANVADIQAALTGVRVTVIGTNGVRISRIAMPGTDLRIAHLEPGAYLVGVEGLADGQSAYFAQSAGITVTAGHVTTTSLVVQRFQPELATNAVNDSARV